MAQIRIEGLLKEFGSSRFCAVDRIDLTVKNGEVMALLGPSGCGKTTTLQLLAGFITPTGGTIHVGERLVSSAAGVVPPERRNMSLIFQSYAVWPHKTVYENVAFGLQVRKLPAAEVRARVTEVLGIVRLGHLSDRYPAELSGGQQQRVALARAIAPKPEILLLDEPLSNLDAALREEMRFEIRSLHDETGITMVYVTHDQSEAMVTADRIALMNQGKIEQLGTPEELYERPASAFAATFLGRTNTLEGLLVERGAVQCGNVTMRVDPEHRHATGTPVFVCVRPHQIAIGASETNGSNRVPGRIVREVYLGDSRDYLIEIESGGQVRVSGNPAQRHAVGENVVLSFPAGVARVVER